MSGMYTILLREKGTDDTPFFVNLWPDSQRRAKEKDYLLNENHNKEEFANSINQLVKKLHKMEKAVSENTSAYKLILKTDHVNENKHVFYSLELVEDSYSLENDEQIVFFDNRIKGYKLDRIIKDMITQLIRLGGSVSVYSREPLMDEHRN